MNYKNQHRFRETENEHSYHYHGIETARLNGKQIGQRPGNKLHIKKKAPAMEKIRKYSRDYDGSLPDVEVMTLVGLSRNTYYKYKKQMRS